jgi:hypothetical protein
MTGFNYRRKITINKNKVIAKVTETSPGNLVYSDQVDVPVLIEVIDKDLIFKNGACGNRMQDSEGRDISFSLATAPTVPLNFQLDEYDPVTGRLTCWVRLNTLSANRTTTAPTEIYFYYGGTTLHNSNSVAALQTWNSDYTKVWHMKAIHSQAGIHQMNLPVSGSRLPFTEGKVAKSATFDGNSTFYTSGNETNTAITISAWIKINAFGTEQMILTNDSSGVGGFQVKVNAAGKLVLRTFNSLNAPHIVTSTTAIQETGRWYHLWATFVTGSMKFYIDNVVAGSSVSSLIRVGPGGKLNIGSSKQNDQFFNGQIDEVRLQKVISSKELMATCYENQNDPKSFYTVGAEEYSPGGFSRFIGTNSQWNLSGNWTGNVVPQANSNILIPVGKKVASVGNTSYKSLIIEAGGTLEVSSDLKFTCLVDIANGGTVKINDGATLRLGGSIRNDGLITSSGINSKVIFEGIGLEQEYDGTGFANVSVLENNQFDPSNTLLLNSPLEVTSFINLKKGVLQSARTLVMKATSQTATASLLPVNPTAATILGDVIVEQYISGGYPIPATARGWRLLSSPVYMSELTGSKVYDSRSFKEEIFVTGSGGPSNGFDISPSNGATIYTHDQSLPGSLSQKYVGIKSIDQKVAIGKGVYVFSRGSRHALNAFVNQIQIQPFINPLPYTIKHVGKLFIGSLDVILANKDLNSIGDGFNLVGNPYASNLKWGDVTTEKTTRFIWQFDPLNAAYIVDDSPNVIIPQGTGFFVRVTAGEKAGKLTFLESSKLTSSAPSLPVLQSLKISNTQTVEPTGILKIIISNNKFQQPFVLKLTEQGFDGLNDLDALKIGEGYVNISSIVDQELLSVDNRRSLDNDIKVVNLNVTCTESGSYMLRFQASFADNSRIKLIDTYLNTEKRIEATDNTYVFSMDKAATGSTGNLRFKVLIDQVSTTTILKKDIKIYPNPFSDNISIEMGKNLEETFLVVITDMLGKVVTKSHIGVGATLVPINTQAFSKGLYILQVINKETKELVTSLKVIKI